MVETRDYVIVGSGFGGSIPALRLAQAGADVLTLERGKRRTRHDFRHTWTARYMADIYTALMDASFEVTFRYANTLGGGSTLFSGAMLRPPTEALEYIDSTGYPVWPESVTRKSLDPYCALVEKEMSITQARWDEIPKPGAIFAMMLDNMGRTCDRIPFPYVDCIQCGFCEAGCRFDRKRGMTLNYIPQAEALGAEFRTECSVWDIEPHASGYRVNYQTADGTAQSVVGRRVLIAANAIESPALLLRSASKLTDLPANTGRNFHNNGDVAFYWELPEGKFPEFRPYKGRNNAAMMSMDYWPEERITIHTGSVPPGIFAGTEFSRYEEGPLGLPWGTEHKHWLKKLYTRGQFVSAVVIGLTDGEGEVSINAIGKPQISLPITPLMQAYHQKVMRVAEEIGDANNARVLKASKNGVERGGAHLLGTCRMGDDPAKSVTNPFGQLHGYPGLYCTDSSSIPGSTGVNPALTIAANAERIAAHLVETN